MITGPGEAVRRRSLRFLFRKIVLVGFVVTAMVLPLGVRINSAQAAAGVPSAPTIGVATAGDNQATVTWTVAADNGSPITSFVIYETYVSGTPFDGTTTLAGIVDTGAVGSTADPTAGAHDSDVLTGLGNGSGVAFSVVANNANGFSATSSLSNVVTPGAAPNPPTSISATGGNQAVQLMWTAANTGGPPIEDFVITPYAGSSALSPLDLPAGALGSNLDPTAGALDSYIVPNLENGTPYTFTISATNELYGAGSPSTPTQPTTPSVPLAPFSPTSVIASNTDNQVELTWTVPSNNGSPLTSYTITPHSVNVAPQQLVPATVSAASTGSTTAGAIAQVFVPGLLLGTPYQFTVQATNAVGTSAASLISNFLTPSATGLVAQQPTYYFESTTVGDANTDDTDILFSNRGSVPDNVTGFTIGGADPDDFVVDDNGCGEVGAYNNCSVSVAFIPGALGTRTATLTPIDAAGNDPTVELIGGGTEGYYIASANGGVDAFGDAQDYGNASSTHLHAPIVSMATTGDNGGYWLVASDGGIFAFGDAKFYGSTGAIRLNQPIVGMAATADGGGYWLVAADGGIFTFGDATFLGSTGAMRLNKPIVGMAATADDAGYWLVASDGGIFAFGDAQFDGSTGAIHLNEPIVGMVVTPDNGGYWLVASDGGIFAFGDAPFDGSDGAKKITDAVVIAGSGPPTQQAILGIPAIRSLRAGHIRPAHTRP